MRPLVCSLTMAFCASICQMAPARPTYINIVPNAEVRDVGTAYLSVELEGTVPASHAPDKEIETEFGLMSRLEAGFDTEFPGEGGNAKVSWDAKYLVMRAGAARPAVAVGTWQGGEKGGRMYYAVATRYLPFVEATLGAGAGASNGELFGGLEHHLTQRLELKLDAMTGPDNFAAIGAEYALGRGFEFRTTLGRGARFAGRTGYETELEWQGSLF